MATSSLLSSDIEYEENYNTMVKSTALSEESTKKWKPVFVPELMRVMTQRMLLSQYDPLCGAAIQCLTFSISLMRITLPREVRECH